MNKICVNLVFDLRHVNDTCMHVMEAVWKELEKENPEFFEAYSRSRAEKGSGSERETRQRIQNMVLDSSNQRV